MWLAARLVGPRVVRGPGCVTWGWRGLALDGGILNSGFIDRVRIRVQGGDGGNGSISFGGGGRGTSQPPWGGSGGKGGDVVFVARPEVEHLGLEYKRTFRGARGGAGGADMMKGKVGSDLVVEVPVGTIVKSEAGGDIVADLKSLGDRFVASAGARGGVGNGVRSGELSHRFGVVRGESTAEAWLELELKTIADVALVGAPNAGKSSLLAALTTVRPKVAAYAFTTLRPMVGAVHLTQRGGDAWVRVADIPGLVEGAAGGRGLGTDFLRHVERCKTLLFVVDAGPAPGGDVPSTAGTDLRMLLEEVAAWHGGQLADRPKLVFANKMDLYQDDHPEDAAKRDAVLADLRATGLEVLHGSVDHGDGLGAVAARLRAIVAAYVPPPVDYVVVPPEVEPVFQPPKKRRRRRKKKDDGDEVDDDGDGDDEGLDDASSLEDNFTNRERKALCKAKRRNKYAADDDDDHLIVIPGTFSDDDISEDPYQPSKAEKRRRR